MAELAAARLRPVDIGNPKLRGVLHTYGFFAAIMCGLALCLLAAFRPAAGPVLSCAIYTVTLCGLLGISALFHRRVWSERGYRAMKQADHVMIFIFIAGTYTPLAVLLLLPDTAPVILAVVWGGGLLGVAMKLIWRRAPRWVGAPVYVALGWVGVAVMPDFLARGGVGVVTLIIVGGLSYTVGAVIYALRRPNPWPTVFGHHEIFHAFTLIGASCHLLAILLALYV